MKKNKCVFLDRDGVLNRERGDYTYRLDDFEVMPGVPEVLKNLKEQGYMLIVITNQAGISRGIYSREEMKECHEALKKECDNVIDDIYYCPYHPNISSSIARKPDSLMFEKAMAKYNIDPSLCWMIGDRETDILAARKVGVKSIVIGNEPEHSIPDFLVKDIREAGNIVLSN